MKPAKSKSAVTTSDVFNHVAKTCTSLAAQNACCIIFSCFRVYTLRVNNTKSYIYIYLYLYIFIFTYDVFVDTCISNSGALIIQGLKIESTKSKDLRVWVLMEVFVGIPFCRARIIGKGCGKISKKLWKKNWGKGMRLTKTIALKHNLIRICLNFDGSVWCEACNYELWLLKNLDMQSVPCRREPAKGQPARGQPRSGTLILNARNIGT